MKKHSEGFKENIKLYGRELDSLITYSIDGKSYTITSEDINSVTPSFSGNLLKSVMKQLDIDSNIDIPKNTVINYKFGVKVDGVYEYVDFGNYVVFSSEKKEDAKSYQILCYDKLMESMRTNEELDITYPISIRDYINAIASKIGLVFANKNDEFANYDKMIKEELYFGLKYTFRDILDELAQVTASIICVNDKDELEIRYPYETNDTIDEEYLNDKNVNFQGKFGPINSIVLSRSAESDNVYIQDEDSIKTNGLCEVKISDNQILNWNDRSDYLPDILNKLNGLFYYVCDYVSKGVCYYDLYDKYNVKIGDTLYPCIMFDDEICVTQGLCENICCEMPTETQTDYSKSGKDDGKLSQVYLIVNKQEKKINGLVSEVSETKEKIVEFEESLDGIKLSVEETNNKFDKEIITNKQTSGNPIEIYDAGEYPLESIGIEGDSCQETTIGKNLFASIPTTTKNGVTFTHNEDDDSYDIVGTASATDTSNAVAIKDISLAKSKIENGKKYTLSTNIELSKDDINIVCELYGNNSWLRVICNSSNLIGTANTTNADTVRFYILVKQGRTVNIKGLKIQLEEGTEVTSIEKYTGGEPSPNSNYLQEIKTVQGATNLFDTDTYSNNNNYDGNIANAGLTYRYKLTNLPKTKLYIKAELIGEVQSGLYFVIGKEPGYYSGIQSIIANGKLKEDFTVDASNWDNIYLSFYPTSFDISKLKQNYNIMISTDDKNYVPYGRWLEQIAIGKNRFCMKKQYFVNKSNVYQSFALDSFETNKLRVVCKYAGTYTEAFADIPGLAKDETYSISYKITENTTSFKPELKLANKGKVNASGYLRINVELNNSSTNSVANTYITFDEIQIVKEEFANDEYEEYKENSALINLNKENLFNSELELGGLNGENGEKYDTKVRLVTKEHIPVKSNCAYFLNYKESNIVCIVYYYDKNKKFISHLSYWANNESYFNVLSNAEYIKIVFRDEDANKNMNVSDITNLELFEGYNSYYELASIGDTRDKFLNGLLTKKIQKLVLTGDESILISLNSNNGMIAFSLQSDIPKPYAVNTGVGWYDNEKYALSTHFKYYGYASSTDHNLEEGFCLRYTKPYFVFNVLSTKANTVDKFKAFLKEQYNAGNPVIVYYILAEPQTYELPYERLKLHKGYNYITLKDELYPNIEITYLTDSALNAQYAKKSELTMTEESIRTDLSKKVSTDNFETVIEEVNNTFEQKITDSEASTESLITRTKDDTIKEAKDYTDDKVKDRPTATEMTNQIKQSITDSENKTTSALTSTFNDKLKGYTTTTQMNNAVTQIQTATENKIALEVSNIKVGASNLVLDSAKEREIAVGGGQASNRISVTPGEEIAVSFDVKGASAYTGNIALMEYYQNDTTATRYSYLWITGSVKTSWSRIEKIITIPKDVYSIDFGYRSSSNVKNTFRNVQIERGNKVTSYRPSSEDYSTTDEVNGKLELKVGTNEYNKIVSMLNAAADEITFAGGTKIHLKSAGKIIIEAGNFKLNENGSMTAVNGTFTGTVNATSGKIGEWVINKYGDMYRDVGNYRTFIQGADDGGANTWAFSTQEKDSKGDYSGRFIAFSNGNLEINTTSNRNAYLSINNEKRNAQVRFIMNTSGHYGIYDEAFGKWREYFSHDGLTNKWILPAYSVSLDYFFTSENVFMFRPSTNGDTHLGGSKWRWIQLWAVNATSTSSDETEKRDMLEFIEKDNAFFDKLKPISFYRKKGDRRHFGFGAQTVEKALKEVGYTSKDFAGLCFDKKTKTIINEEGKETEEPILDENGNEELSYSLRYEEFISLNTWQIQKAKERISDLENTVKRQQETIDNLIKRIEKLEEIEGGK